MNKIFFNVVFLAFLLIGCRSSIVDDPSTTIQYTVSQPSNVRMEIENSYNTVIAVPVDDYRPSGTFSVSINASMWLEGIYYYTIECKGVNSNYYYKSTRTMILIK